MAVTSEWKGPPESWTSLNFQVGDLIEIQEDDNTSWALYIGHAQVVYTGPSPDQHSTNQDTASSANQNTTHAPGGDNEATNQNTATSAAGPNEKDSNIQYQLQKGLLKAVIGQHTVRINNMYDGTRLVFPVQTLVELAELHIGENVRDRKDAIVNLRYERPLRGVHPDR
ncbi:phospholipase A and acyltransferase 1-like isoform X1 [Branchiostoma floridae x Branchiostoma japonicum]